MQVLKAGTAYFALVFGTGFILGTIRTLWVVPSLGIRTAELLEMPLMLLAIVLAAFWINRSLNYPADTTPKIAPPILPQVAVGMLGLFLLLITETIVGVSMQGLSIIEVFTKHDPISGAVYYLMLGVFAAMPWVLWKFSKDNPGSP